MREGEYGQEVALTQPFDNAKHIANIGDFLILLALERLKWKANGMQVVELLKEFTVKMDAGYIRKRHLAKPEFFGRHTGGLLEVSDPQIKQQVKYLMRVIRVLPFAKKNPPYPMCIRDDIGNYFAWTPSSFGMQAATDEERDVEQRRRDAVTADQGRRKKDIASPLFD